jgi:hypothetical protein
MHGILRRGKLARGEHDGHDHLGPLDVPPQEEIKIMESRVRTCR